MPARTSEWPLRYLVAEWKTRSAPCSIGRVSSGGDVDHLVYRIDRCLDPHQPRLAVAHDLRQVFRRARIEKRDVERTARVLIRQPGHNAEIAAACCYDVRSRRKGAERRQCGRHAGRKNSRIGRAFE